MTCKSNIGETTRFLKCTKLKRSRCVGQLVIRADQHSDAGGEAETTDQVERLEQIFELIKHPAKGKTCDAINGMIDETQEVMKEFKGSAALDAGLLASAQTVEHYEISRYGTLKAWAEQLGLQEAVRLLVRPWRRRRKRTRP